MLFEPSDSVPFDQAQHEGHPPGQDYEHQGPRTRAKCMLVKQPEALLQLVEGTTACNKEVPDIRRFSSHHA